VSEVLRVATRATDFLKPRTNGIVDRELNEGSAMQDDNAIRDDNESKRTFLNRRDWGSYLSALQSAATYPVLEAYPKVLEAVKSSRDWFAQGATQASNWLVASAEWRDKFSTG
jgi:hypothetical protein